MPLSDLEQVLGPLYGDSDKRWPAFQFIANLLYSKERPVVIVETGSIRNPSNFAGDGCATQIWNWIARDTDGAVVSIDIDPHATQTTHLMFMHTRAITSDSVTALRGYLPRPIDLLYLDSYDYQPGDEVNSLMHQVSELGAIWGRLPSGCLIASDDCHSDTSGKHVGTAVLLKCLGIEPIFKGYITVWRKP